jgi:Zn-dependent M28 family amino/carboxypeptidase
VKRVVAWWWLALVVVAMPASGQTAGGFDGQAAFRHLEKLVGFGPRPAGSPALARARDYIVAELRRAGIDPIVQKFPARTPDGTLSMTNVIGVVRGRREDVIIVAGHYDTKYFAEFAFVGANDGGSSAALLLELATRLGRTRSEFTYWIAFFDGEEARRTWTATDSLYGSRHMVDDLRRTGRLSRIRAMILVDMIGDRDLNIRRETNSTGWLTDIVWASARRLGHGAHFLNDAIPVEDDHAPFLREGVPATLLIDFDYPPWHTPDDTLAHVSARSLQIVGEVVLDALPAVEGALRERAR